MLKPEPCELQFTIQQPNSAVLLARRRRPEARIFARRKLGATRKVGEQARSKAAEQWPGSTVGLVLRLLRSPNVKQMQNLRIPVHSGCTAQAAMMVKCQIPLAPCSKRLA